MTATPPIEQRASAFESRFPPHHLTVDGLDWTYHTGGSGTPLLLLTGGAGIAIGWLDLALALGDSHRIIAVDYPAADSFAALADGIVALLDACEMADAHVIGQSMGGMLAEVLSRRAPSRVRSLTLTGTGLYGEEDRARLRSRHTALASDNWEDVREQIRASLRETWSGSPDLDFWITRIDAATACAPGRTRSLSTYPAFLDLIDRLPELGATPPWPGPTLFLRADDDPLITETHAQRLLAMHPGAEVRRYPTGGHSLLLTRTHDYIRDITEFLHRQD